ncbi:hypothetical protein, partial [Actinomadura rubrobrunea]
PEPAEPVAGGADARPIEGPEVAGGGAEEAPALANGRRRRTRRRAKAEVGAGDAATPEAD